VAAPLVLPKPGEDLHAAVNRECLATRNSVGVMDASTLGKIDVKGPDAREFLNRIYSNAWSKLDPGKCRYGLMLDENGMVMDDGVTACLADDHFHMTTTTGGAARVYSWLERWHQTEWPELKVRFTTTTDHWATVAVVGPNSRKVLQKLCTTSTSTRTPSSSWMAAAAPWPGCRRGCSASASPVSWPTKSTWMPTTAAICGKK
jgi:sarcosine oxidase subunit alpha